MNQQGPRHYQWPQFNNVLFYGRKDRIDSLEKMFHDGGPYPFVSITGFAGLGKTSLVQQLLRNLTAQGREEILSVIWLEAKTEQVLKNNIFDFIRQATLEELETRDLPRDMKNVLMQKYTNDGTNKVIIVLDSVSEEIESAGNGLLTRLLQALNQLRNVLIISTSITSIDFFDGRKERIELTPFHIEDSRTMVRKMLELSDNHSRGVVDEFCTLLCNCPLALRIGINLLKERITSGRFYDKETDVIQEWIETYKSDKRTRRKLINSLSNRDYALSISNTLIMTVEQIEQRHPGKEGKIAIAILKSLAWMGNCWIDENGIMNFKGFFRYADPNADESIDEHSYREAVDILGKYKLILFQSHPVNEQKFILFMHGILNECLRNYYDDEKKHETITFLIENYGKHEAYLSECEFKEAAREISLKLGAKVEELTREMDQFDECLFDAQFLYIKSMNPFDRNSSIGYIRQMLISYNEVSIYKSRKFKLLMELASLLQFQSPQDAREVRQYINENFQDHHDKVELDYNFQMLYTSPEVTLYSRQFSSDDMVVSD